MNSRFASSAVASPPSSRSLKRWNSSRITRSGSSAVTHTVASIKRRRPMSLARSQRSVSGDPLPKPPEPLAEVPILLPEILALLQQTLLERLRKVWVDTPVALEFLQFPKEVILIPHISLEKVPGAGTSIRPKPLDQVIEEDPLVPAPHAALEIERSARREGEEVHPFPPQVTDRPRAAASTRSARSNSLFPTWSRRTFCRAIWAWNRCTQCRFARLVRPVPQVIDGLRDHTTRHEGLPRPTSSATRKRRVECGSR